MKVRWNREAWHPVYTLDPEYSISGFWINIPKEKYKEYQQLMKEFLEIQKYIEMEIEK